MVFILLQICQRDLEYPALERIIGVFETGGPVDKSLSNTMIIRYFSRIWNVWYVYSRIWNVDGAYLSSE